VLNSADIDESKLAMQAVARRAKTFLKGDPEKFKSRVMRFLAGRGFSYETIEKVLDGLKNENEDEDQQD
jgi:SOS response regulatory protein OraA/RecX